MEESALELAKARELRIACDRLLIYAKAQEVYGNLFGTSAPELVPEGFTVTGPLTLDETAALYGEKLYVRGADVYKRQEHRFARLQYGCHNSSLRFSLVESFSVFIRVPPHFKT